MQPGTAAAVLSEPLSDEQIAQLPVYEWDVAQVGDEAPPFVYTVTEQSIADYCAAVRNTNRLYLDHSAAADGPFGGIIAPPTFAFKCAPLRRNEVMHARGYASPEEKGLRATPYAKAELHFARPIRPGDEITSIVRLQDKYERRGNQFITWHTQAHDAQGAPVVEYTYTIIWYQAPREAGSSGTSAAASAAAPVPAPAPTSGEPLPRVVKQETQEAIDRYAELTRVRPRRGHSLHSDEGFAKRTIFGGTVNMGVATAAYCSEVLEQAFGPAALLRPGARLEFKGIRPVRAGDTITIGGQVVARGPGFADCALEVHNQSSTLVGVATARVIFT
jgi:acyl dehydratase